MNKHAKMNWTISILNMVLFILIPACASGLGRFPADFLYVADVTNQVCVKYKIIDYEKLTVQLDSEVALKPKGDCDRLVGFHRKDYNEVKNWVRDAIAEFKKKLVDALETIQLLQNRKI